MKFKFSTDTLLSSFGTLLFKEIILEVNFISIHPSKWFDKDTALQNSKSYMLNRVAYYELANRITCVNELCCNLSPIFSIIYYKDIPNSKLDETMPFLSPLSSALIEHFAVLRF